MIERGDIYWADPGRSTGRAQRNDDRCSSFSADAYNRSRLATVLAAVITSKTKLAAMPGNVFPPAATTALPRDSGINVTALVTLRKTDLADRVGKLSCELLSNVERGPRGVVDL